MANPEHLKMLERGRQAWNDWRKTNPKIVVDLSTAYISETSAEWPEPNLPPGLGIADLSGFDLSHGILSHAILKGAILRDAILFGADLEGANLRRADMRRADLRQVKFFGTNLTLANLADAEITRAIFWETVLARVNLTGVLGLEYCRHGGPSVLDERTIRKSGGLPKEFLRGCGLSDALIEYLPSLRKQSSFYSCFISYSTADRPFARKLHDALQDCGIRCWLDEKNLVPGDDLYEQLDSGIRLRDKVLLCCSENSLKQSWWVDNEIRTALEKERELQLESGKPSRVIVPLNLDGFLFGGDWTSGYRAEIRSRVAADFTDWKEDNAKFDEQLASLVRSLRVDRTNLGRSQKSRR